jgi:hypothetical protein
MASRFLLDRRSEEESGAEDQPRAEVASSDEAARLSNIQDAVVRGGAPSKTPQCRTFTGGLFSDDDERTRRSDDEEEVPAEELSGEVARQAEIANAIERGAVCQTPQSKKKQQTIAAMFSLETALSVEKQPQVAGSQVEKPPTQSRTRSRSRPRSRVVEEPHNKVEEPSMVAGFQELPTRSQVEELLKVEEPSKVAGSQEPLRSLVVDEPQNNGAAAEFHHAEVSEEEGQPRNKGMAPRMGFSGDWTASDKHMFHEIFGNSIEKQQLPLPSTAHSTATTPTMSATPAADTSAQKLNAAKLSKTAEAKMKAAKLSKKMPAPTKPVAEDTEAASTERAEGQKKRKLTKLSSARGRKKTNTEAAKDSAGETFAGHRAPSNPTKRAVFMQIKEHYFELHSKPLLMRGQYMHNDKPVNQQRYMQHMKSSITFHTNTGLCSRDAFIKAAKEWEKDLIKGA